MSENFSKHIMTLLHSMLLYLHDHGYFQGILMLFRVSFITCLQYNAATQKNYAILLINLMYESISMAFVSLIECGML